MRLHRFQITVRQEDAELIPMAYQINPARNQHQQIMQRFCMHQLKEHFAVIKPLFVYRQQPLFSAAFFGLPHDRQASAALPDLDSAVPGLEPAAAFSGYNAEKPPECIGTELIAAVRKAGQADSAHRIIQIPVKAGDGNILRNSDPCLCKCRDQRICHDIIGADDRIRHGKLAADQPLRILHRCIPPEIAVCIIVLIIIQTVALHDMKIGLQTFFRLRGASGAGQAIYFSVPVNLNHMLNQQRKCLRIMRNRIFKIGMLPCIQQHHRLSGVPQQIIQILLDVTGYKSIPVIDEAVKAR